jgi:hypothetical protein
LPSTTCVEASGETRSVHAAPPGSIEIVARLLTVDPICDSSRTRKFL